MLLSLAEPNEYIKCPACFLVDLPTEFVELNIFGNEKCCDEADWLPKKPVENISNYNWLTAHPINNVPTNEAMILAKNKMPLEISLKKPYRKRLRLPKLKKKHDCTICQKNFPRNCDLTRHLATHSQEN